ncbi:hypothetical protein B0H14DRAFT_3528323 [Mycena olivaceomarginata]|nr:hypothetical protein B0H14DRAFT_3528323 [Mycena olivaceomarginata]
MHIHPPHFGQVVSVSANGRSAIAHAHVVNTQSQAAIPSYVQEDLATNAAVESWDFSYDLGETLLGEVQAPETDGIVLAKKKKVYENSDYPMLTWANENQDKYLNEMLHLEGRGYPAIFSTCGGNIMEQQQLMRVCWWPATARAPQTCATFAVIRLFRTLNCLGKVSVHDFLKSLELLTNNDALNPVPDRHRAFHHIVCQYRITSMMKRAGRGHDPPGVHATVQGEWHFSVGLVLKWE